MASEVRLIRALFATPTATWRAAALSFCRSLTDDRPWARVLPQAR